MIIDIQALTKSEQLNFNGEQTLSFNQFNQQAPKSECNVKVEGVVTKDGSMYTVSANLQTVLTVQCDRCMKEVKYPIHANLHSVFSANPIAGEEDVKLAFKSTIDLSDDIMEAVVMEIPMKVLCKEDCLGLCTKCGGNRNENPCKCHLEDVDPRLEGLKDIFCQ